MATLNKTGVVVSAAGVPAITEIGQYGGAPRQVQIERELDLTGEAITENDIYQLIPIPINHVYKGGSCYVITAAVGTTCTIDVGTGGGESMYSNIDGKATGWKAPTLVGVAEASVTGLAFTTGDTIDVTFDVATAITAGPKLRVVAFFEDHSFRS